MVVPVGTVARLELLKMFGYDPDNWLPCLGQWLWIEAWPDIYEVIGTAYGGDEKTFRLPLVKDVSDAMIKVR